MTKEKITALINKMQGKSFFTDQSESVSYRAHIKAEELKDPGLLPLLREIITENDGEDRKEIRKNAYFIMISVLQKNMVPEYCQYIIDVPRSERDERILCSVLDDAALKLKIPAGTDLGAIVELFKSDKTAVRSSAYSVMISFLQNNMVPKYCQCLIDVLGSERDKYVLHFVLSSIEHKLKIPEGIELNALIECCRSDKWIVRHSAICALQASDSNCCREEARYWASQSDEKKYKYEIIYANASLGVIGVPEDIALLETHIRSRIRNVKDSALFAINSIKTRYDKNS